MDTDMSSASNNSDDSQAMDVSAASDVASVAAASQARMHPHPRSAMIEWLNRDANTPCKTLEYLPLRDLARLCCTCSSWRTYLSNPSHLFRVSPSQSLAAFPQQLALAAKSTWLPRCLQALQFTSKSSPVEPDFFTYSRYSAAFQMSLMKSFAHLKMLTFHTLPLIFTPDMFEPISQLASLESLTVRCTSTEMRVWDRFAKVSLAPLAKCKHLETFSVRLGTWFYCTKQQVMELLECESLTSLDCGAWTEMNDESKAMGRTSEQRIAEGLALLHQLPRLRYLEIAVDSLGSVELHHLCKISNLTCIRPFRWIGNIDGSQWKQLLNLPALSTVYYAPPSMVPSSTQAFVDLLPAIPSLTALQLKSLVLREGPLEAILSLKKLKSLQFLRCQFPSLNSFAQAPSSLQELHFIDCSDLQKNVFNYHVDLPVIPSLQRLNIFESWYASNEWCDTARRSNPHQAMIVAFKFMLSKRFNIPESAIEYEWPEADGEDDDDD